MVLARVKSCIKGSVEVCHEFDLAVKYPRPTSACPPKEPENESTQESQVFITQFNQHTKLNEPLR